MYIIGKKSEKDYYDGVAGTTGIDKTIVYERCMRELENEEQPKIFQGKRGFRGMDYRENPFHAIGYHHLKKEYRHLYEDHAFFIIGFCGKLYLGWKFYERTGDDTKDFTTRITYDVEYVKSILEPHSFHGNLEDSINYIFNFKPIEIFRELNVPIFVYDDDWKRAYMYSDIYNHHSHKFIINPILKEYEFGRIFDAYQAFQEISMFLSGVLGNKEKEIVQVADKYKIAQHGFDKWSFRKEPQDKK